MTDGAPPLIYRPRAGVAAFLGGVFLVTAAILLFLGWILGPDDVSAMDGVQRLLFNLVSIRWFSWIGALAFGLLGARIVSVMFRTEAALEIRDAGLTIRGEGPIPWLAVGEVRVRRKPEVLEVEIGDRTLRWSPFELGADPSAVAAELGKRRDRLPDPS